MPLLQCPDCRTQVSEEARSCPKCGCPRARIIDSLPSLDEEAETIGESQRDEEAQSNEAPKSEGGTEDSKPSAPYGLLGLLAAALIGGGLFTNSWRTAEDVWLYGDVNLGLLSMESCAPSNPDNCETIPLAKFTEGEERFWVNTGRLGVAAGILTILLLLTLLVFGAELGRKVTGVIALSSAVTLTVFFAFIGSTPEGVEAGATLGASSIVGILGAGLGIVTGLVARPAHRKANVPAHEANREGAAQRERTAPPDDRQPSRTAVPACPKCDAPTRWVSQYERFRCDDCRVYV